MAMFKTPILLLLLSAACCAHAIRPDPAAGPVEAGPVDAAAVVPQATPAVPDISTTAVSAEAATPIDPTLAAAAAVDVASVPVEEVIGAPVLLTEPEGVPADSGAAVSAQAAATAASAFAGKTLGIGFSGSGFLVMYHVGVTAILRALGIISATRAFAGSSGGAVAAAYTCSNAPLAQATFRTSAAAVATTCRALNNCRLTLDGTLRSGLIATLPIGVESDCANRLFVAVTQANNNRLNDTTARKDVRVFVSGAPNRGQISEAVAASSYIPRFSGISAVTLPIGIGIPVAYDGVGTDPLPVPPGTSGATYTIKVSAIAGNGANPPTNSFDSIITTANTNPPACVPLTPCYTPLDPTKITQPATVDIYPGLAGGALQGSLTTATWNNFLLTVPSVANLNNIYNQGRNDAVKWVRTALVGSFTEAQLTAALAATV